MPRSAKTRQVATALALLSALSSGANAQATVTVDAARGTISGEVVDAETLLPLRGASVVLIPAAPAVLPPVPSNASSFPSMARVVHTSDAGAYQFAGLPAGSYQLRVQRVGYRPITLDVDLRASDDARLSVGLTVAPIRLHALTVRGEPQPPFGRLHAPIGDQDSSRVAAARLRQRLFLGSDVREVTHPDVVESVTLGATDLFRAFHRLPGVTTRDDEAAELWTRGSRPDLTRVYFDGLPIFSPLHSFGLLSGIGTNAVSAAFLHPGVRPVSIGEGGAAVVDLRSRSGGGSGAIRGITEITTGLGSLLNAGGRIALDQRVFDGRGAWMLAGGRSISDLWFDGGRPQTSEAAQPAYFADLVARVDYGFGGGRRFEASGLWLRDSRQDDPALNPYGKWFGWGSEIGRATLTWPLFALQSRHTIGVSRYSAAVDTFAATAFEPWPGLEEWFAQVGESRREAPLRSAIVHSSLSGEFEPIGTGLASPPWRLGYEFTSRRVDFEGDVRYTLLRIESARARRAQSTPTASLWGTWRWSPTSRWRIEPGLRLDFGSALANAGAIRPMPSVQARFAVDSQTSLSAGVGRSIQYTQTVGRLERAFDAIAFPTALWLVADDSIPALFSDVATIGVERWLSGSWLAAANAYHRRSTGYLVRDPAPGPIAERGLLVAGAERASGMELSARKLAGPVTGSVAYTYGFAQTSAGGFTFASSQDRRHSFDATLLARLKPSVQLSAAYTYATGAPYTRLRSMRTEVPSQGFPREVPDSLVAEGPNVLRMPPYSSLDLAIEWTFGIGAAKAATYFQIQNVLRHKNFGPYSGERWCTSCRDAFYQRQIMRPAIGIRARF